MKTSTDFPPFETKLKKLELNKSYKLIDVFNRLVDQGDLEPYSLPFFITWLWSAGRPNAPQYKVDMPYYTGPETYTITRIK